MEKGEMLFAASLAKVAVSESVLLNDPSVPFSAEISAVGHPRVLVVVGDNASGKSLFFQIMGGMGLDFEVSPINISIRERTGAGTYEMSGMRRAMMFGDESEQSTGATSARVVATGFKNVLSRLEDGKRALLYLDEPEMGLSDGYAYALGEFIGKEVCSLPEEAPGVVVVTHNRRLVKGLVDGLGADPSLVNMSGSSVLSDWLSAEDKKTIDDLLDLPKKDNAGRNAVSAFLRARKEKRSSQKKRSP